MGSGRWHGRCPREGQGEGKGDRVGGNRDGTGRWRGRGGDGKGERWGAKSEEGEGRVVGEDTEVWGFSVEVAARDLSCCKGEVSVKAGSDGGRRGKRTELGAPEVRDDRPEGSGIVSFPMVPGEGAENTGGELEMVPEVGGAESGEAVPHGELEGGGGPWG